MRISFNLLGSQGSGKGTQADALLERYDFTRFDLGENLRAIEEEDTDLGRQIASYVDHGHLVPADLIAELTKEKLAETDSAKDVLFDGLLRQVSEIEAQKETFAALELQQPVIIFLDLDEEAAIERLSVRRICSVCRSRYRISPDAQGEQTCQRCGGNLVQRQDDRPEAIKRRLEQYHDATLPVLEYFRKNGKVIEIDASPAIEIVTTDLVQKIDQYYSSIGKTPPRK